MALEESVAQSGYCPECDAHRVFIRAAAYRENETPGWCCRACTARFGQVIHHE